MSKFPTQKVIKFAAYETHLNGYTKRTDDANVECTADIILNAMLEDSIEESELEKINNRIKEWGLYINNSDSNNEYFNNIKSEISKSMIDESKIGLIASSFSSFDKHILFKLNNERDRLSEYLGEEGDTISVEVDSYRLVKSGTSKYNKGSMWFLYNIKDSNGNIITIFSNEKLESEFKKFKNITGVISKLSEYNGIKQTQITKVKFE